MLKRKTRYLIGIDEAGRGPLAGPVAVGAVMVPADFDPSFFHGIRDSKQMNEAARERWFMNIRRAAKEEILFSNVSFASHSHIDKQGIVPAITSALERAIRGFDIDPTECRVFLDGGLRAPKEFLYQETIIKGDVTVPLISAAAVMAKVSRDRRMKRLARRFPQYGFEQHKGYGTQAHHEAIHIHGLSPVHRATFCHF